MRSKRSLHAYPLPSSWYTRIFSFALAAILIAPSAGYGVPGSPRAERAGAKASTARGVPSAVIDPATFTVPENFGTVTERFASSGTENSRKVIIQIQDSHCQYEAQTNIARMLELMGSDPRTAPALRLIAVEAGAGTVKAPFLRDYPSADARALAADQLVKVGWLTGAELYYASAKGDPVPVCGVEDMKLYDKNLSAFRECKEAAGKNDMFFGRLERAVDAVAVKVFSGDAREIVRQRARWDAGEIKFTEYCKFIADYAIRKNIARRNGKGFYDSAAYPAISTVMESFDLEKTIDRAKVTPERTELVNELEKKLAKEELSELIKQSLSMRIGRSTPGEFYTYLKKVAAAKKMDMGKYPNLARYIELVSLHDRLNPDLLFDEVVRLEGEVKGKVFATAHEKSLSGIIEDARLLGKLADLRMSRKELAEYRGRKDGVSAGSLVKRLSGLAASSGAGGQLSGEFAWLEKNDGVDTRSALAFYDAALARDGTLVAGTIAAMEKDNAPAAAVVAGGFHTQGMTELFKAKGYSYVVVMPRVTKKYDEEIYLSRMLDKPTAFDRLFGGAANQLGPKVMTLDPAEIGRLEEGFLTLAHLDDGAVLKQLVEGVPVEFSCKESDAVITLAREDDGSYLMTIRKDGLTLNKRVSLVDGMIVQTSTTEMAAEGDDVERELNVFEMIMQRYAEQKSANERPFEEFIIEFLQGVTAVEVRNLISLFERDNDEKALNLIEQCADARNEYAMQYVEERRKMPEEAIKSAAKRFSANQTISPTQIALNMESLFNAFKEKLPPGPGGGGAGGSGGPGRTQVAARSPGGVPTTGGGQGAAVPVQPQTAPQAVAPRSFGLMSPEELIALLAKEMISIGDRDAIISALKETAKGREILKGFADSGLASPEIVAIARGNDTAQDKDTGDKDNGDQEKAADLRDQSPDGIARSDVSARQPAQGLAAADGMIVPGLRNEPGLVQVAQGAGLDSISKAIDRARTGDAKALDTLRTVDRDTLGAISRSGPGSSRMLAEIGRAGNLDAMEALIGQAGSADAAQAKAAREALASVDRRAVDLAVNSGDDAIRHFEILTGLARAGNIDAAEVLIVLSRGGDGDRARAAAGALLMLDGDAIGRLRGPGAEDLRFANVLAALGQAGNAAASETLKTAGDKGIIAAAHPVGNHQDIGAAAKREILNRPAAEGSRRIYSKKEFLGYYPALADAVRGLGDGDEIAVDAGGAAGQTGAGIIGRLGYEDRDRPGAMAVKALSGVTEDGKRRLCMTQDYFNLAGRSAALAGTLVHEAAHLGGKKTHTQAVLEELNFPGIGMARIIADFKIAAGSGADGEAYLAAVRSGTANALLEIMQKRESGEISADDERKLMALAVNLDKLAAVMSLKARLDAIPVNAANKDAIGSITGLINNINGADALRKAEKKLLDLASFMRADGEGTAIDNVVDAIVADPGAALGEMARRRAQAGMAAREREFLERQVKEYFERYGVKYDRGDETVRQFVMSLMHALNAGEKRYLDTSILKRIGDVDQLVAIMQILITYENAGGELIWGDVSAEKYDERMLSHPDYKKFLAKQEELLSSLKGKDRVVIEGSRDKLVKSGVQKIKLKWMTKDNRLENIGFMVAAKYLGDYEVELRAQIAAFVSLLVSDEYGKVRQLDIELMKKIGLDKIAQQLQTGDAQILEIFDYGERTFNYWKNEAETLVHA